MKTYIAIIFLLVNFLLASTAISANRGIVPVPILDTNGKQVGLYKESYALIVGVSEYSHWPNLPGVEQDIQSVKQTLENHGFHTIVHSDPDYNKLTESIENFINQYGQDPDNRLLFYFAGHGHTLKLAYGEEMGYLVSADSPNPNQDKAGFLTKALDMQQIEVYAKRIQSKHALFMFDSCFSGSIFSLSRSIPKNISFKISQPVRQFITAGSKYEQVPDKSIFRAQFVSALNGEADSDGDGYITGVELGEFLQKTVVNYSKGTQHPQYGKIRSPYLDKGDFVFSLKKLNLRNSVQASIAPMLKPPGSATPIPDSIPSPPQHPKQFGHLQVNVNVANARVNVNGEFKGIARLNNPLNIARLPIGNNWVHIESDGYTALNFSSLIKNNDWTEEWYWLFEEDKEHFVHKDQIKDIGDLSNVNVRIFSSSSPETATPTTTSNIDIIHKYDLPRYKRQIIEQRHRHFNHKNKKQHSRNFRRRR
jgi:hypothetical protein